MQIVVLANDRQRQELSESRKPDATIEWIDGPEQIEGHSADVLIDLLFVNEASRIQQLARFPGVVVINSVVETIAGTHPSFTRINGWNTFLSSPVIEAASSNEGSKQKVEEAFSAFGKTVQWLPDEPGFVAARVVSMIISEACLALEEGISTKEEINTAMKLGTAYPFGPFEWAEKIGVQNVVNLLERLAENQPRYKPAALLKQFV